MILQPMFKKTFHDWVLLIYSEFMFLLVLLLLLFRKFSKYLWSSNSATHIMPGSCLFRILTTYLFMTSLEKVPGCHLQSVWMILGQFFKSRFPLSPSILISANNFLIALPWVKVQQVHCPEPLKHWRIFS